MPDSVLHDLIPLFDAAEEHDESGDPERAAQIYGEIIARAPEHPLAWHRRGMLRLFELNAPDDACADFEKARLLGVVGYGIPQYESDYVLGEALFGVGRHAEALQFLGDALDGNEDDVLVAEIHFRRAECADELDDVALLRASLEAFLRLERAFVDSGGEETLVDWARERLAEASSH